MGDYLCAFMCIYVYLCVYIVMGDYLCLFLIKCVKLWAYILALCLKCAERIIKNRDIWNIFKKLIFTSFFMCFYC